MDYNETIPPVIRILLDEDLTSLVRPKGINAFFTRLMPELLRQAEWSNEHWASVEQESMIPNDAFSVALSRSINPLDSRDKCAMLECRIAAAHHFARTIGLYADVVTLPDPFTLTLLLHKRFTPLFRYQFTNDVIVLHELAPLIRAGIVRFRSALYHFCEDCYQTAQERIKEATDELFPSLTSELTFTLTPKLIVTHTGRLYNEPLSIETPISAKVRRRLAAGGSVEEVGRQLFRSELRDILEQTLINMHEATALDSPLFSASRLDLFSLRALEKSAPRMSEIEAWEEKRSVELPWVKNLSVEQIVRLRNEAADALPRFRETMRRALCTPTPDHEAPDAIGELREDAAELSAELKSLNVKAETRFRNLAGALGIVISVYGFASGFAPPTVALSLLSLLGLLHSSASKDEREIAKHEAHPAYVLVKALEISQHDRKLSSI